MTKSYELEISPILRFLPLVILTLLPIGFVLGVALSGPKGPPAFLLVPLLPIFGWQWWMVLTLAYRVVVHEDGAMEWVALARTVRIRPENVLRVGPDRTGNIGFFTLTHTEGKVRFINQITGFHEIVNLLEARSPRLELKGC